MKRLILSVILVFIFCNVWYPMYGRQRNTIYVFDCTGSMRGYGGAPDIWDSTKDFLKNELEKEAKEYPAAMVTILPFQGKALSPIYVDLSNFSWPDIDNTLDRHIQQITGTNICDPWLEAENFINETCENYIVLMTDGQDTVNSSKRLAEIFTSFCGKFKNTKAFYVELTKAAKLPEEVQKSIDVCDDIHIIPVTDGIPSFGAFSQNVINVNTRDLPADYILGFSNSGTFGCSAFAMDNPYITISVKDDIIKQGKIVLHIESKFKDITILNKAISGGGDDVTFKLESKDVIITNPNIELVLNTKPIRSLDLAESRSVISAFVEKCKLLPWEDKNITDTIRWNISPKFSGEAVSDKSTSIFRIKSDYVGTKFEIYYDGEKLSSDSLIVVKPGDRGEIDIIVPRAFDNQELDLSLIEIDSHNLDRINNVRPNGFILNIKGEYKTKTHFVMWILWGMLAVILLFIIAWFGYIRSNIYPKFKKGNIIIQQPYFANIRLRGYRMIVFGPTKSHQNWFDKIWKGKVLYLSNPAWQAIVDITPSGKNMRFNCKSGLLVSTPGKIWSSGNTYTVSNQLDRNSKIVITV